MQNDNALSTVQTLSGEHWGLRYLSSFYPEGVPSLDSVSPNTPELAAQPVLQGGRQAAWFIDLPNGGRGVLRHYRRGGLVARCFYDQYLWLGAERTRSWAEFEVMCYLHGQGVPVPMPVAASWHRHWAYYRAALITEQVPGARTLASLLSIKWVPLVARAIKKMHDAGVYHADLNAFNILIDAEQAVWLIDFDRARRYGRLSFTQRERNLQRLQRSLLKLSGAVGARWYQHLAQAYNAQF